MNGDLSRDLLMILTFIEGQEGRVTQVEDWAEIRWLHRAEEMPLAVVDGRGVSERRCSGRPGRRDFRGTPRQEAPAPPP